MYSVHQYLRHAKQVHHSFSDTFPYFLHFDYFCILHFTNSHFSILCLNVHTCLYIFSKTDLLKTKNKKQFTHHRGLPKCETQIPCIQQMFSLHLFLLQLTFPLQPGSGKLYLFFFFFYYFQSYAHLFISSS